MEVELTKQNRKAEIDLLEQDGQHYRFRIDDQLFDIDLIEVSNGIYSLINNGKSFNVEAISTDGNGRYTVNTFFQSFDLEFVDARTRYLRSRNQNKSTDSDSQIRVPMPGKVVDVLVSKGDEVKAGQTLVIVAAMKMESEYKAGRDAIVRKIFVKPGDTVDSDQVMVILE
jgi:biotin carboxyl carrier protein